ncbi:hypothetical protein Cni_G04138 [Canna indica]|uniref:Late embryogenesis abundant protein LEA-2 subgroup domain-containing protein n=1 Tax=Canna indica TaxID=4628 RepID=A0AAQ3JT26_9LILI|nr:hypothetical protein Cni_G04138 [Canna indica]
MTHTLDIPPPPAFAANRELLDGPKYVMLAHTNPAAAPTGSEGIPPLRPPPYRRSLRFYLSGRHSSKGRSCCRCCLCCFCSFLLFSVFLFAALLLYVRFTFDPQVPSYKIEHLDVQDFEMSSRNTTLFMAFAVTVRAQNPNKKIGIRYLKGGTMAISYKGTRVGSGLIPAFYQRPQNTTEMVVTIKGRSELGRQQRDRLLANKRRGNVPLDADVRAPVGFTVRKMELLKVTVGINCSLLVGNLSPGKKTGVKSTDCSISSVFN